MCLPDPRATTEGIPSSMNLLSFIGLGEQNSNGEAQNALENWKGQLLSNTRMPTHTFNAPISQIQT